MLAEFITDLFEFITAKYSSALITRIALTLLNIWQAYVIVNRNYWIPNLISENDQRLATIITVYSVFLAIFSVCGMFDTMLDLALGVLAVTFVQYLYITIAALWFVNPPRASAGMTAFIAIVALASFWRVFLLRIRQYRRPEEKITQWIER